MPAIEIENTFGDEREWERAFPAAEYAERLIKVQAEMARVGVDTLYVSSPANITYLTGYDSRWYRRSTPTGLVVNVGSDAILFFDDVSHRGLVSCHNGRIPRAAFFRRFRDTSLDGWIYKVTAGDLVDTIKDLGWLKSVAAVEHWALAPGGKSLRFIAERMADAGARTVDGSWIVDRVKLVKSPAEIAMLDKAAVIADAAIEAVVRDFRPGMTEIEVQGIAHFAMSRRGGEEPAIRSSTTSGPNLRAHHPLPTRRKIAKGDIFVMDLSGSLFRYHANIARTFAVGEPDRRWTDLVETSRVSFDRIIEQVRPGDPMEKVVEVAMEYLNAVGIGERGWFIGGYDVGIAIPPDWVGHTYLNGRCFERADFVVGTVANFENVLDVAEGWPGGYGVQNVDTLVMEESGLRILSRLDRSIKIIGV
ncbi:MAG: M24 family metallopeptidase [Parvibaculaceae bacterium]